MTAKPFAYRSKRGIVRVWTCDLCGERFEWRDKPFAEYHGSFADAEAEKWDKIKVVCGRTCKKLLTARKARSTPEPCEAPV